MKPSIRAHYAACHRFPPAIPLREAKGKILDFRSEFPGTGRRFLAARPSVCGLNADGAMWRRASLKSGSLPCTALDSSATCARCILKNHSQAPALDVSILQSMVDGATRLRSDRGILAASAPNDTPRN